MAASQSITSAVGIPQLRMSLSRRRLAGKAEQDLMAHTYFGLRWGLGIAAFLLPLVTRLGEWMLTDHSQPDSISGYYHTGMRNYFIATLMVIAAGLFLYKGFSRLENLLLNVAGIATALIAFFPTGCDAGATECASFSAPAVHGTCAIIAFGCIGIVAIFLGPSNLDLLDDERRKRTLRTLYRAVGLGMLLVPGLTAILAHHDVGWLYWVELGALWIFVLYWGAKTVEFHWSSAEVQAMSGELPPPQQQPPSPGPQAPINPPAAAKGG